MQESKSAIEARPMVVVGTGEVTINPGEDWSSDDIVQVSGCNDIETTLENGAYKVDQVLVNDDDSPTLHALKNTDDLGGSWNYLRRMASLVDWLVLIWVT